MSLKAKIEAVIYASEEPVTLAQLVSLLSVEAQAELDALAAQQESLPLDEIPADSDVDPDALNAEVVDPTSETEGSAEPAHAAATDNGEQTTNVSPAEPATDLSSRPESSQSEDGAERPAAPGNAAPTDAAANRARNQDARRLRDHFRSLLDQLIAGYASDERGLEIREVAGGFRFATKPQYHDAVRGFVKSLKPPLKLSLQALETLAVIAYKQPVTAPEISEIRGVDSGGVLGSLMARKLVATAGRKQVIGRPILYKTTKEFLVRFGLKDLNELPSIEEFEKMANEFAEAVQEEIPMSAAEGTIRHSQADPAANVHEAQPDGTPYSDENAEGENPTASNADPADDAAVDGRISGLPPNYDRDEQTESEKVETDGADSPAIDAEVQSGERNGGA